MDRNRGIGNFKSLAHDHALWVDYDSSHRFDWNDFQNATVSKPGAAFTTLTLRLPENLVDQIKIEAKKRNLPYPMLIKVWLAEAVERAREL